jgi:cytidine diphosphoramidate kinase
MTARGGVIWVTGLSGAGKTTVATEVLRQLTAERPILLDGDDLRAALGATTAYDHGSRHELAYVYARLCRLIAGQGHTVVCATIAMFHDVHAWNRANLPGYLEVYLEVPIEELERRNSKGIYAAQTRDEAVGVGIPAQLPLRPDLIARNTAPTTPVAVATDIVQLYRNRRGDRP